MKKGSQARLSLTSLFLHDTQLLVLRGRHIGSNMKRARQAIYLVPFVFTLGCNLLIEGANDGQIGDDEAGEDVGEGNENFTQDLWCGLWGGCVVSIPGDYIAALPWEIKNQAWQYAPIPNPEPIRGTCENPIVNYPCGIILDPVLETEPLVNGGVDLTAFAYQCALCPENDPPDSGWYQGDLLESSQVPFCMRNDAYNGIGTFDGGVPTYSKGIDTFLAKFDQNFVNPSCPLAVGAMEPNLDPFDSEFWVTPKMAPRGFAVYRLDEGPIGLCESDIDCEYLTDTFPFEGEGVCEGWPFLRTVDPANGTQIDTPRGCFRITEENGGVVPPLPSVGGMMVEDNLSCGDFECEVTMPFVEAVIDDAITASVGLFWSIEEDHVHLTDVKSYSLGSIMGLQSGDKIRGSVEDIGSVYANLVEHGSAQLVILRGRETRTMTISIVE